LATTIYSKRGEEMTRFIENMLTAWRDGAAWKRAHREDVGFGLAGVCPHCQSPQSKLINGWYNNTAGTGKAQFRCQVCKRSWTWSRKPKAVPACG
jgi:hypothetical protein